MVLEELLHKSKEIVKNDKDKDIDNIYNLLIDVSNAKYPLAEYGGLSGSNCEIKYPEMSKEELREFEKEAERQYDARTEEISKIAENVENYVEEKYPSIRIDGYPESHWCDAFGTHMKHYFLSATYSPNETNNVRQDSEIKLYFNMPYEKIEDFFKECASFAIENNIFMYYKTRYENATDMVTVRFYDIEKLDGIVNCLSVKSNSLLYFFLTYISYISSFN